MLRIGGIVNNYKGDSSAMSSMMNEPVRRG
jgi:hypothetical protein